MMTERGPHEIEGQIEQEGTAGGACLDSEVARKGKRRIVDCEDEPRFEYDSDYSYNSDGSDSDDTCERQVRSWLSIIAEVQPVLSIPARYPDRDPAVIESGMLLYFDRRARQEWRRKGPTTILATVVLVREALLLCVLKRVLQQLIVPLFV